MRSCRDGARAGHVAADHDDDRITCVPARPLSQREGLRFGSPFLCCSLRYLLGPLLVLSVLTAAPARLFLALAAPLPMVTAALGWVPSLRAAVSLPRICASLAPVFSRDSANFAWCSADP